jgi:putative restriction endonuclease
MKFWVGITDNSWFAVLSKTRPDELNFWQPGGNIKFKAIPPGQPFLFKLHSPLNFIVGGGYFLRQSFLPVSIAWDTFAEKNGCTSYGEFTKKIMHYRERNGKTDKDPTIGCLILIEPFFFDRADWIPVDPGAYRSIVVGKTLDSLTPEGMKLWREVQDRLNMMSAASAIDHQSAHQIDEASEAPRYGSAFLTQARIGQGAFRVLVTEAYDRRCAITGERTLPVLQAAHIKPYAQSGPHSIANGLLLRSDLHILFDKGYITVTPSYDVEVSKSIKEEFSNGRDYYALHGKKLAIMPSSSDERPASSYLDWHNNSVYKG